jgi:SAM-dependent methyltransferase
MRLLIALLALLLTFGACTTERPGLVAPDVLFVGTPELVGLEMLRLAGVNAGDVVYDLGSGDGRLVIAAAREFGARGIGVEIEAALVQTSRESAARAGVADRVRFLWQDLFATDLADATVVTLYLRDDVNLRLRPRLLGALRPGTRVVSHDFGMADWTPDRIQRVRGPDREHTLYLWLVPAGVAGTWEATLGTGGGARRARLEVRQRFQELNGSLEIDDRRLPLRGTVAGTAIEVTAGGWVFSGRVAGDRAAGRATERGRPALDWRAHRAVPG